MAYVDDSGGTFIGNIGFGGVTPGFAIHCEKSVADKLAFFKNTSASGYGVRFQNGSDNHYTIKVTNAAETADTLQRVQQLIEQANISQAPLQVHFTEMYKLSPAREIRPDGGIWEIVSEVDSRVPSKG